MNKQSNVEISNLTLSTNPISSTIDFDADGIQHGHLKLPYSHDESAWGSIMIPISVVKHGDGPTALLTGGNHGDEYEGPLALLNLTHTIDVEKTNGRIVIIPMMNYPALKIGRRISPIDKGNMNRSFPGKPDGGVTEKIADYFQRTLLPLSDYVLDIHSGGRTLEFVPFAAAHVLDNKQQQTKCVAAMQAFNAPYSLMLLEIDNVGMYDTAAEDMGKIFVSTELGGGGTSTHETVDIAKRGVRNLLIHAGILSGEIESTPTLNLHMPDNRCFITSESNGLIEYCANLGDSINQGRTIARVYDISHTGLEPIQYKAEIDGLFIGRHFPGHIGMGDCLAIIAVAGE